MLLRCPLFNQAPAKTDDDAYEDLRFLQGRPNYAESLKYLQEIVVDFRN